MAEVDKAKEGLGGKCATCRSAVAAPQALNPFHHLGANALSKL